MDSHFTIEIEKFRGPFDLLLFFIERDELDIYDIPIAKITDDFLQYIRSLEELNIDIASEFILVAATLMRIKARMLLPRKEVDEEGNEIDPRDELVQKLLEYKKYKSTIHGFQILEANRQLIHLRGNTKEELSELSGLSTIDLELEDLTLYKLLNTFDKVMLRFKNSQRPEHHIFIYKYNIEEQQEQIISKLDRHKKLDFLQIFENLENRLHAIVRFLALLELLNNRLLQILQGEGLNNFWIRKNPE